MGAQTSKGKGKLSRVSSVDAVKGDAWAQPRSPASNSSASGQSSASRGDSDSVERLLTPPPAAAVRAACMRGDAVTVRGAGTTKVRFCVCKWKQIEIFIDNEWETSLYNLHIIEERGRMDVVIVEEGHTLASMERSSFEEIRESLALLCAKASIMYHAVAEDDEDVMRCEFCDVLRCRESLLLPCFVTGKYHVPEDFAKIVDGPVPEEANSQWRQATVLPPGAVQDSSLDLESVEESPSSEGWMTHRSMSSHASSLGVALVAPVPTSSIFPSAHTDRDMRPMSGSSSAVSTPRSYNRAVRSSSVASLTNASFYTGSTSETREMYTWECPSCTFSNSARKLQTSCISCGGPQPRRRRGSIAGAGWNSQASQGNATPRTCTSVHGPPSAGSPTLVSQHSVSLMAALDSAPLPSSGSEASLAGLTRSRSNSLQVRKCMACKKQKNNTVFMPCRHVVCCSTCAPSQQRCPQCQVVVSHRLEVFV